MSGLLTPAEEFAITVGAKVTRPTVPCTDPEFVYVRSESTDLRKRFENIVGDRQCEEFMK